MQGLDTSRMHHPLGFLLPFEKDEALIFPGNQSFGQIPQEYKYLCTCTG